jgi:hypothetical protein
VVAVDPTGLAVAASRIADVLAELMAGDPAHPPLGADPASTTGAVRLSTAAATLVACIGEQALCLAATAAQLLNVGTTFELQDIYNKSGLEKLGVPDLVAVTGWAPPSPPMPPDIRPPMVPPPPLPAEAISAAVHSGDPNTGAAFIDAWTELVSTLSGAADTVRSVGDSLPEAWDSPVSTEDVRAHLYQYAAAFDASAERAATLARQADRHAEQNAQARQDIPPPDQYSALRQQIQTVSAANIASGGKYAGQLGQLLAEKAAMDGRTVAGYGSFHTATDATTAAQGDPASAGAHPGSAPWDPNSLGGKDPRQGGDQQMTPEKAGQMASMLPQIMSTMLGAAGGLVGGAVQTFGKVPETLMQAGSQLAGQASQSLGGLMKQGLDKEAGEKVGRVDPLAGTEKPHGGGGGAGTMPAGGAAPMSPSVMPTTGPPPKLPSIPSGALPEPAAPASGTGGMGMPMGMPLGGMAGAGHGGARGQEPPQRAKKIVQQPQPHTESVTGKVAADRLAVSSTAPEHTDREPPDDDPPQSPHPVVRRITMPSRDDEP